MGPYVEAHASGLTPNPCIECNRHIKFDALLDRARQLNFDRVATGHHAQIVATENGPRLSRGADLDKDQSYVLYMLSERDLKMLEFPIGHMKKTEVRELANELGLRSASKPDSQDVCFITASEGRGRFLSERLNLHAGQVVDMGGNNIGTVDAVELVTVGQRKGLKLGGNVGRSYAVEVDIPSRRVVAGSALDLLSETVELRDHFWIGPDYQGSVAVQTSAHGDPAAAHLNADGSVQWAQARRKVAPGQAVVFYLDDAVIGGAIAC